MLLMTRVAGEAIAIGEQVVVKVLAIEGGRVQLGIEAPREMKVRTVAIPAPQVTKK